MRVSYEWLQEYVKIDLTPAQLADKLTMAGIAVEAIEDQSQQYQGIYVARIVELAKHNQADNLLIAKLEVGVYGEKQVITAAKNLKNGDLVPLALPGTILPNGKLIEETSFKGVCSQGMMCSGEELALEKESTGIWVFSTDFIPGTTVAEALGATDQVLVLELTANRSDCLGMLGVAREVAAILNTQFISSSTIVKEEGPEIKDLLTIRITDPDMCPRYSGRVVANIKIGPSPEWMQRRLQASGVRPINNVVDITNYVMLEYNQPLHAFDFNKINNHQIIVRRAKPAEQLTTLDGVERQLTETDLLIADPVGALCVAGVMGGSSSEVTNDTSNLLLESAYFNPLSIRKTGKTLGLRSESSFRFERGIDPNGSTNALNRAAHLIEELGIGTIAKGIIDQYPKPITPLTISTSATAINKWLGTNLSITQIKEYLERVTFSVKETSSDQITVTVPTYRQDVSHMADLAEEVARLYGYDQIPATLPPSREPGGRNVFQKFENENRKLLQGIGLSEIMSYSLYSRNTGKKLGISEKDFLNQTIDLMVPLSEEQAVMRTNLIHGLLECMAFNAKRRQHDLAVFEIARVYWRKSEAILPDEPVHLGVGLMGLAENPGWNQCRNEVDFYDLKGIMELIFDKFKISEFKLERSDKPFLHPGQAAEIIVAGQTAGFLGQIHPTVAANYDLAKRAYVMELDLSILNPFRRMEILFETLPKFPAVERDIALVLPKEVRAAEVSAKITDITGHLVERVDLFDVYQGEQVPDGQRSLAFRLLYRSKERTLNDSEVNQVQEELLRRLNSEYGASVRS